MTTDLVHIGLGVTVLTATFGANEVWTAYQFRDHPSSNPKRALLWWGATVLAWSLFTMAAVILS